LIKRVIIAADRFLASRARPARAPLHEGLFFQAVDDEAMVRFLGRHTGARRFCPQSVFLLTEKVVLPPGPWHRADVFYYLVAKERIPDSERHCDFFCLP